MSSCWLFAIVIFLLKDENVYYNKYDDRQQSSPSTFMPVMVFVVAQLLLGCGGSPLLTLGTTYVDDHVRPESSSMYIGELFKLNVIRFKIESHLKHFNDGNPCRKIVVPIDDI